MDSFFTGLCDWAAQILQQADNRISSMYQKYHDQKIFRGCLWFLVISMSLGILCIMNYITPYHEDDLWFIRQPLFDLPLQERPYLSSFQDVVQWIPTMYFTQNGRIVAHAVLIALFYFLSKAGMAFAMSALTVLLCLLISRYSGFGNQTGKYSIGTYCLAFSMIVCFNPVPDETLFWASGFFNYAFTAIIILLFFMPYMKLLDAQQQVSHNTSAIRNAATALGMFLFGIIAGWTNENMGPTLFCAGGFIVFYAIVFLRQKKIPVFYYTGLAGVLIGVCAMMLAPGNFIRITDTIETGPMRIIARLYYIERSVFECMMPSILLLCALIMIRKVLQSEPRSLSIQTTGIIVWALISFLAMCFSPSYPTRATLGTIILLIIAITMVFQDVIKAIPQKFHWQVKAFSFLWFVFTVIGIFNTAFYSILKA